ncbi:serine/threonine-protein kinase-like protein [Byssothecium circinans]|uniref:Serine/threonine-protein kinase-like protein n=1 Tax=Byssothecium circinans TaxID=147558 RepID=A0A6A5T971_9PLEO|nr:serine/threonine-protein kinase-like protein [Byssothecium circinans]
MGASPALSPRPGLPPAKAPPNASVKAKTLAILNNSRAIGTPDGLSRATTPGGETQDLAEQMNNDVREQFVSGAKLGEGTYAVVYRGHFRADPTRLVAIKKMKINVDYKDGITMDSYREMKFLQELKHPNIIDLYAVFTSKDQNISLVLEHLPKGDLEGLWKDSKMSYTGEDIKAWSAMLCQAVWFCHENFILHRDIKGNNVLIAADNTLKLADFGLARSFSEPGRNMTCNVITRFYRPPELLLGAAHYGGCVDVWSTACVIAELATRNFFLPSETDLQQLTVITDLFGIPTEADWPGISSLRHWEVNFKSAPPKRPQPLSHWRQRLPVMGEDGIDLLRQMMIMDPSRRLSARQVLEHPYWTNMPRPTKKENLPQQGGGEKKMGEDLKRVDGQLESGRMDKVARKLDFGAK